MLHFTNNRDWQDDIQPALFTMLRFCPAIGIEAKSKWTMRASHGWCKWQCSDGRCCNDDTYRGL